MPQSGGRCLLIPPRLKPLQRTSASTTGTSAVVSHARAAAAADPEAAVKEGEVTICWRRRSCSLCNGCLLSKRHLRLSLMAAPKSTRRNHQQLRCQRLVAQLLSQRVALLRQTCRKGAYPNEYLGFNKDLKTYLSNHHLQRPEAAMGNFRQLV